MLPPANNLADADVRLIVPVPVTVRPVALAAVKPVVPASDQVPEPIASTLVPELPGTKLIPAALPLNVKLYPFASKVPLTSVRPNVPEVLVTKASCNVTDPPGVLIVNGCVNVLPALVIV